MESYNHSLFLFLNAGPDTPQWAIQAGTLLAKRVIYLIPLLLTGLWLWGDHRTRESALKGLVLTVVALGCNHVIGMMVHTPRPFELAVGHTWLAHAPTAAFPSNHLTIFTVIGLSLAGGAQRGLGILVLVTGAVVAWSRIFVGVHFPIDMAGALVVGIAVFGLMTPAWRRVGEPVTTRLEAVYRHVLAWPISAGWLRY